MKFLTIQIALLSQFQIDFLECAFLTAVAELQRLESNGFWAVASNSYYCNILSMNERTLQNMTKRLQERGLLRKGIQTQKRASEEFCLALIEDKGGVKNLQGGEKFAPGGVKNLHPGGEEFAPNNTNNNTSNTNYSLSHAREDFLKKAVDENRKAVSSNDVSQYKNIPLPDGYEPCRQAFCLWLDSMSAIGKRMTRQKAELAAMSLKQFTEGGVPSPQNAVRSIVYSTQKDLQIFYKDGGLEKQNEQPAPKPSANIPQKPKGNDLPAGAFRIGDKVFYS